MESPNQSHHFPKAQTRRATVDSTLLNHIQGNLAGSSPDGTQTNRPQIHQNIEDAHVEVDLLATHTPTFVEASEMRVSKGSSYNLRKRSSFHLNIDELKKSGFANQSKNQEQFSPDILSSLYDLNHLEQDS
jgi:hypothetical protein